MSKNYVSTTDVTLPIMNMARCFGCHPKERPTVLTAALFWIFSIAGIIYTCCSVVKSLQQDSLQTFSVCYIDFLVASQTNCKILAFYVYREKISKILDVFWNDFWPVDIIPEVTEKANGIQRVVLRGTLIYRAILTCCIIQISTFPLLMFTRALPYNFFFFGVEDGVLMESPYYELTFAFECLTLSVPYALALISFDMLFIALSGCVLAQFDMLKHKLLRIGRDGTDEETTYENLKKIVRHHCMLLQFIKNLEEIFTFPILKQYVDAITCMGIYIYLSQQDFHFLYLFSLMTNLSQTLFFSSFGQLIQNRSYAIADAATMSEWYEIPSRRVRQALVLVTLRAQIRTKVSAGGFINLSFESFVQMLKAAGSFLAVLRSTKEE